MDKFTVDEIITLRKEIISLRWLIRQYLSGMDTREREEYRIHSLDFEAQTKALELANQTSNQDA